MIIHIFLPQSIFNDIQSSLPFFLTNDYFASRLNYKLPIYFSLNRDPYSFGVNAFSVKWRKNAYLFPPIPLINRTIQKFISDNVKSGLLITPFWASKPWFSSLLNLLIAQPFLLPSGFIQGSANFLPKKNFQFLGWPIGCDPVLHQEFLEKLPRHNFKAFPRIPLSHTKRIGDVSVLGVIKKKLITVRLP